MGPPAGMVWRPGGAEARPSGSGRRGHLLAVGALGVAACVALQGGGAFVGGARQERPAGRFVITEELPRGLACRASYELAPYGQSNRDEWNPLTQWRGEKSYHPTKQLQADENRQWYHFDAEGKVLGRLAQVVAHTLRGKDSALYDPTKDVGSFVIVTNCEKVRVSGKKYHYKLYFRNLSHRPGHLKLERFKDLQKRFPERIIMRAVWGAMPKTKSCRRIFKERLKLFEGPNHLYYHMNPIDWPMHHIKDCTHTQNTRTRDRVKHFLLRREPLMIKMMERRQALADKKRLHKYKMFLKNQLNREGPEEAERMDLDELSFKAERNRMAKVLENSAGKPTPPTKVIQMIMGTNIPKKKIARASKRRR